MILLASPCFTNLPTPKAHSYPAAKVPGGTRADPHPRWRPVQRPRTAPAFLSPRCPPATWFISGFTMLACYSLFFCYLCQCLSLTCWYTFTFVICIYMCVCYTSTYIYICVLHNPIEYLNFKAYILSLHTSTWFFGNNPAQTQQQRSPLKTPGAAKRCPTAVPSLMPKVISIQMDFTCCQKFKRNAGIP